MDPDILRREIEGAARGEPVDLARAIILLSGLRECASYPGTYCGCAKGECRIEKKHG